MAVIRGYVGASLSLRQKSANIETQVDADLNCADRLRKLILKRRSLRLQISKARIAASQVLVIL